MDVQRAEKPYRVYIVDDDQFLLDMYMVKFREAGCEVEGFTESKAALERLKSAGAPDAMLLDLVMPGMDGLELLRTVRTDGLVDAHTAVVILSNQGQDSDMQAAREHGIDGYLIKASTVPSEVLTSVLTTIRKKQPVTA